MAVDKKYFVCFSVFSVLAQTIHPILEFERAVFNFKQIMAETQVNINLDDKEDEMIEDVEEEDNNKKGPRRARKTDDQGRKAKGRGFKQTETDDDRYAGSAGKFDLIDSDETGPIRCE